MRRRKIAVLARRKYTSDALNLASTPLVNEAEILLELTIDNGRPPSEMNFVGAFVERELESK